MACADVATAKAKAPAAINLIIDLLPCFTLKDFIMPCVGGQKRGARFRAVLQTPIDNWVGAPSAKTMAGPKSLTPANISWHF
jgi:hypothetical protein